VNTGGSVATTVSVSGSSFYLGANTSTDATGITINSHTTGLTVNNSAASTTNPNVVQPFVSLNFIIKT
jgi:hypothetical protein